MKLVTIDVSRVSTSLCWIHGDPAISLFHYYRIVKESKGGIKLKIPLKK